MRFIPNTMRSRVALLCGLGLAMLGMCSLRHVYTHPNLRDKVSLIRYNMTKPEVHEVVGCPPGNYRTKDGPPGIRCYQGPKYDEWLFDDGDIMVTYSGGIFGSPFQSFEVFYREGDRQWQRPAPHPLASLASRLGF
jgi:hypothetical protein